MALFSIPGTGVERAALVRQMDVCDAARQAAALRVARMAYERPAIVGGLGRESFEQAVQQRTREGLCAMAVGRAAVTVYESNWRHNNADRG